jgi:hypothetical protein
VQNSLPYLSFNWEGLLGLLGRFYDLLDCNEGACLFPHRPEGNWN